MSSGLSPLSFMMPHPSLPIPFRSSFCHSQNLPQDFASKFSSQDVTCFLGLLEAVCEGVLAVLLTVVCWCVTLDDSCVNVSLFQSHFYEPAVD